MKRFIADGSSDASNVDSFKREDHRIARGDHGSGRVENESGLSARAAFRHLWPE